ALGRPHVCPQDAAPLDQGIGRELDLLDEAAFLRFGGHLDALPGNVELPAVIGAAQAAFLVAAKPERCAAMRAELVDEPVTPEAVTQRHQPLADQLDTD